MTITAPPVPSAGELNELVYGGGDSPLMCILLSVLDPMDVCGKPAKQMVTVSCLACGRATIPICGDHYKDVCNHVVRCATCFLPVEIAR